MVENLLTCLPLATQSATINGSGNLCLTYCELRRRNNCYNHTIFVGLSEIMSSLVNCRHLHISRRPSASALLVNLWVCIIRVPFPAASRDTNDHRRLDDPLSSLDNSFLSPTLPRNSCFSKNPPPPSFLLASNSELKDPSVEVNDFQSI
jgi:hypothetical protein